MPDVDLLFPHAFTLGLEPGKALKVKAGEILAVAADDVERLKIRFGATDAPTGPGADDLPRVDVKKRLLPEKEALRLCPDVDLDKLAKDHERADKLAEAKDAYARKQAAAKAAPKK
jgi:hypothetical protein